MPLPATMGSPTDDTPRNDEGRLKIPFVRAAKRTVRRFSDKSTAIGATSVQVGPEDVNPMGFLRNIIIEVTASGGAGGSAVAAGDGPWNVLQNVTLEDTAGRPLAGPLNGYQLYLINKYGAYRANPDPATLPSYSAVDANGDFSFTLRIPVEITSHDGIGSLPNQVSSSTFKVNYTIADEGTVYSTPPLTTNPTVRVILKVEVWSQPPAMGPRGEENATNPPAFGTVQNWTVRQENITAGDQRVTVKRVGNHIRNLIFVFYNDASPSVRNSDEFPATSQLFLDNKILTEQDRGTWQDYIYEQFGFGQDTGVFPLIFTGDGYGDAAYVENRNGWLLTSTGTNFELNGTWGGSGVLHILQNDVSVRDIAVAAGV